MTRIYLTCVAIAAATAMTAAAAGAPNRVALTGKSGCPLLTSAEVGAAIGEPVAKAQGGASATGAVFCNWYGNDKHLLQKGVSLIAATDNVQRRYKSYLPFLTKHLPLTGVGVAAVTDGSAILARNGHAFIYIHPLYAHTAIPLAQIKGLAIRALGRT